MNGVPFLAAIHLRMHDEYLTKRGASVASMTETWDQLIESWLTRADGVGRDVAETYAALQGAPFDRHSVAATAKMLAHTCKEEFDFEPVVAEVVARVEMVAVAAFLERIDELKTMPPAGRA